MADAGAASLRRSLRLAFTGAIVVALLVVTLGVLALVGVLHARRDLVDRAQPAALAAETARSSLIDQETGVRAFVVAGDESFLAPYDTGRERYDATRAELERDTSGLTTVHADLERVDRAVAAWLDGYAIPTVAAVRAGDGSTASEAALAEGRTLFDEVRSSIDALEAELAVVSEQTRADLDDATYRLVAALGATALALVLIVGALRSLVRRRVEVPLEALGLDALQVAGGELEHAVVPVGPSELAGLGRAMEQMRQRIVEELGAVSEARDDLARSNAELEQFAYVASHDLQEPLRKVASFCQLLQTRYAGELDERADQYIEFAVDGAKRMQALINDLLAFSRVGRMSGEPVAIDGGELVRLALQNVASAIEEAGGEVVVEGELPTLEVERSLAVALFQNLIGNAVKFRREDLAPVVHVRCVGEEDGLHHFVVADNGIGIEPEYAERVFVIFQRLHAKEAYAGTGIGLALCRKIVEHHGGRIWVEDRAVDDPPGTTIHFTLPAPSAPDDEPQEIDA